MARTNALTNLPSTCGAIASTSTPASVRNWRASSTLYTRVGSIEASSNPAPRQLCDVFLSSSAPAMQPTQSNMLLRTSSGTLPRTTTSDTANRPPGFNTRKASRSTRSLSAERLMTQFEMMTSTELSGRGMFSISPFRNSTFSTPACLLVFARQRQHLVRHVQSICLARRAHAPRREQHVDPASGARSSTISPGFNSISAVGLPQPSEACTALSGVRPSRRHCRDSS